jgi:hypothetical protein
MGDQSGIFSTVPAESIIEVSNGGIRSHIEDILEVRCSLLAGEAYSLSVFQGGGVGVFQADAGGARKPFRATLVDQR